MQCHEHLKRRLVVGLAILVGTVVQAAEPMPDKSHYTLFNPTPRAALREMTTDRPDKTESPYTVDAGHFQAEMDLLNYSYDRYNAARTDTRVESFNIAPINLKLGLCNNADVQLVVPTYTRVRTDDRSTATRTTQSGFGDLVARLKANLWGNDDGPTAFAVMPYVKVPTNEDGLDNDSVEGGVILPLGVALPGGWGMALMTQLDIVRDSGSSGYHPDYINSITFGHDIAGKLAGYVEFFSRVSDEAGSEWEGTLDFGLTYAWSDSIQLDCGINFGVTRSADDLNPFIGISWRY
jgi:hypothetical protein